MDPKYLIPVLLFIMMVTVSGKDGDPCTSASDCDPGEWCEAYKCKYYSCSTDADCPTCGRCVGSVCYRSGNENCGANQPIVGEIMPLDPDSTEQPPAEPGPEPAGQAQQQDMTLVYLGIIALLVIVVVVLAVKRK